MTTSENTPDRLSATASAPRSLFDATVERLVDLDDAAFASIDPADLATELPRLSVRPTHG